jgi:hypothetical protein
MTPAELRAWIERNRLSHDEAAWLLALSRNTLRKNLYGVTKVSYQTALIIELRDRLAKVGLSDEPLNPRMRQKILDHAKEQGWTTR